MSNHAGYEEVDVTKGWVTAVKDAATAYNVVPTSYTLSPAVKRLIPSPAPLSEEHEDSESRAYLVGGGNALWDGMGAKGQHLRRVTLRSGIELETMTECDIIRDASRVTLGTRRNRGVLSARLSYKLAFSPVLMATPGAGAGIALSEESLQSISDVFTSIANELPHVLAALMAERFTQSSPAPFSLLGLPPNLTGAPVVATLMAPTFRSIQSLLPSDMREGLKDGGMWRDLLRSVAQDAVARYVYETTGVKIAIPFWSTQTPLAPFSAPAIERSTLLQEMLRPFRSPAKGGSTSDAKAVSRRRIRIPLADKR